MCYVFPYIVKCPFDKCWNICTVKKFETTSCFLPSFPSIRLSPHITNFTLYTYGWWLLWDLLSVLLPGYLWGHAGALRHTSGCHRAAAEGAALSSLCRAARSVPVFSKAQLWKATLELSSWQAEHQHRKTDDCTKGLKEVYEVLHPFRQRNCILAITEQNIWWYHDNVV